MGWILRLVETGVEGPLGSVDVLEIDRPGNLDDLADLGLRLAPEPGSTGGGRKPNAGIMPPNGRHAGPAVPHAGSKIIVPTGLPPCSAWSRFDCPASAVPAVGPIRLGLSGRRSAARPPSSTRSGRSFPPSCPTAAGVLQQLLPLDAGPETLRAQTLKVGEDLRDAAPAEPATAAAAITVSVDSTFIRSCEAGPRHLEVRLGNVETPDGARQVFAAVARTDTAIETLIQRGLAAVGHTDKTDLMAFTDGCSGLRSMLVDAGVKAPPSLDWFHIAMRLHHAEKTAGTLPIDTPEREHAKTVIVTEILHWRIWNGKAKDARITLERIRQVMPVFRGDGSRKRDPSSRRLWTALREIDRSLTSQSAWLVNYAERHRAGLRVGTSITEGTANFLVNRRMTKSQQMRWSRRGAHLLLQCAALNGKLGSAFGQLFEAKVDPVPNMAMAVCPPIF